MLKKNIITVSLSAFLFFCFLPSFAQEKIDFRINLAENACFDVHTILLIQGKTPTGMDVKEMESEANTSVRYKVVMKTPASYHINLTYTDFYFKMNAIKELIIDPKNADKLNILDISTQYAMVINKPFSIELSPEGKVISTKENKEVSKKFKKVTKKLSPDLKKQVYSSVNNLIGREALISQTESWTSYMPNYPVEIGDNWTVQNGSEITYYTFDSETDSAYVIKGVGSNHSTTHSDLMGKVMVSHREVEFTVSIEVDKHTFLPKIITKEMDMIHKSEVKDYPAFSTPPATSRTTSTLIISNCNE